MTRGEAKRLGEFLTASGARKLLSMRHPDIWGRCRLNKGLTADQAREIFLGASKDLADDAPLRGLIAANILREWGSAENLVRLAQAGGFRAMP